MVGKLASRFGGFLSGVGRLADKGSNVLGKLASPLKTVVSVGGGLLDPLTGGLSGKVAGAINKGIDYLGPGGGLKMAGQALQSTGNTISNLAG